MRTYVAMNPGIEVGVDTKCCRRPIAEILTAIVTMQGNTSTCLLLFDADCATDRAWSGTVQMDVASRLSHRSDDSLHQIRLRLECSQSGWRIDANGIKPASPTVEESWPLFLEFAGVSTGPKRSERVDVVITE